MKSFFVVILFYISFSSLTPIFGLKLSLKENVTISQKSVKVSDLVYEKVEIEIGNITILELNNNYYKLKSSELLNKLIENGYKDITISGKESIIYYNENPLSENKELSDDIENILNPVTFLTQYLSGLIDKEKFKININITKVEPKIDLESVNSNFNWELGKFTNGLKDIIELKKAIIFIDKKRYNVSLDINILTNVYMSKKSFLENDFFNKTN
ncbi:MAG TPA: hypothetical protein PK771_07075, partial [Spirochaetota bacterium]|nr:hypothetical protein [Spirochaetota bacterium]